MKSVDSLEKIKKTFQLALQEKTAKNVGDNWQSKVMADIRKLNASELADNSFQAFERFFWRFSVAGQISLIVALLYMFQTLCVSTFQTDANYKQHIAQEFLENPAPDILQISLGMPADESQ